MKRLNDSKLFRVLVKVFSVILILGVFVSSLVLPSFAVEERSISDLVGTSWRLESCVCDPGVGKFSVTGYAALNSPALYGAMSSIYVGYSYGTVLSNSAYLIPSSGNDAWAAGIDFYDTPDSYPHRTLYVHFTGGQTTNPDLIDFVTSNGVQIYDFPPSSGTDPDPDPDPDPGDTPNLTNVIKAGYYYSSSNPVFPSLNLSQSIEFYSSGSSSPYSSMSIIVDSSNSSNSSISYGSTVVTSSPLWVDFGYRFIRVIADTTVSESFNTWFSSQFISASGSTSSGSYNSGYRDGYSSGESYGYSNGYNVGFSVGQLSGYDQGYSEGFANGEAASDSESFGENLLGDTLSAPIRALNNFTLYTSASGFNVTLGGVVGAAISLTLFIAFLKIFAGG